MISDQIRKIVSVDHDNQQSGKAVGDNVMWSSVSTKDAGNLTFRRHSRKISDYALALAGHAQGLRLPTRIDSVRLRLRPFAYDSVYPSELSSEPFKSHQQFGHHDSPTPLVHSASIKLSHALIFF